MSEISDELLRTLDRIVEANLTLKDREACDGGSNASREGNRLLPALDEAGFTAIGGTGGDADVGFADAMALVRRAAYHAIPVPLGEWIMARWLAAGAGLTLPDEPIGLMIRSQRHNVPVRLDGIKGAMDGDGIVSAGGATTLVAGQSAAGVLQLAIVTRGTITSLLEWTDAGELRDHHVVCPPHAEQSILAIADVPDAPNRLLAGGALLRAVQMTGAMDCVLEHCMTWVNDRVQFGKPIGKHQAVQHLMAQLAEEVAAAGAAADFAIEASADGPNRFAIAVAKARVGEAAGKSANIAHALFGAMGFTREHPLHYATRRLWAWRNEFGGEAYWQAEIGRQVAAQGGARLWETLTAHG